MPLLRPLVISGGRMIYLGFIAGTIFGLAIAVFLSTHGQKK